MDARYGAKKFPHTFADEQATAASEAAFNNTDVPRMGGRVVIRAEMAGNSTVTQLPVESNAQLQTDEVPIVHHDVA